MKKGIGASKGYAIGYAFIKKDEEVKIEERIIENIDEELARLKAATDATRAQLEKIKDKAEKEMGAEKAAVFESHMMLLDDPEFTGAIEMNISNNKVNAEKALNDVLDMYVAIFGSMEDEYMKERIADVKDVGARILKNLAGVDTEGLASVGENTIVIAHDLTPSDTAQLDRNKVVAFLTNIGGRTSHSAIMARTLEIPAVVGLGTITEDVKNGDLLIVDGNTGDVIVNPDEATVKEYENKKEAYLKEKEELKKLIDVKVKTKSGKRIEVCGNIGKPEDVDAVMANGADGVGLFRTEFLYMDRDDMPSEEEQYEAYKYVAEKVGEKLGIVRTLDIGGDKKLSYLPLPEEENPFLGYRAIRLCLDRKDIFKTQLRALYRASVHGKLRIMFPMISSLEELLDAKEVIKEVLKELDAENIAYSNDVEVGMMIEIPSAAVISDVLAKHVDFFSIGTNDLIQYTCAVDRMNQKISHLYNQFNPAVLRLIKMVIDNAHKEGKWVGMCGESAGDQRMIPILLGFGLDEFSMSPISILPARKLITSLSYADMQKFADEVLAMGTAKEIKEYVDKTFNM